MCKVARLWSSQTTSSNTSTFSVLTNLFLWFFSCFWSSIPTLGDCSPNGSQNNLQDLSLSHNLFETKPYKTDNISQFWYKIGHCNWDRAVSQFLKYGNICTVQLLFIVIYCTHRVAKCLRHGRYICVKISTRPRSLDRSARWFR